MKKILFHSLTIPPDKVSTGMLVAEIASGFKDRGVDVEILASTPQYNFDSNLDSKVELKKISKNLYESTYKNVKVFHISSKKRSYTDSKRIFQWLKFHYHSKKYLFKHRNEYSHIFLFSYPPTMNIVGINSEELEEYIKNERLVKNNLLTINHFSPFLELEERPNINKKSIFYAGNIGKPQNIPLFVNYFNESLSNEWTLNIYGSGEEYKHVKSLENEKVVVNEYTERDKLIELTSDIPFALVSLDPNLTIEGFPGKTFDYLSMNKIILCFANENSAVARFIEKYKVGINIDPKNINNLGDVIEKLNSAHFIEELLNNVAILNKNEINKEKVIDKYLSLI